MGNRELGVVSVTKSCWCVTRTWHGAPRCLAAIARAAAAARRLGRQLKPRAPTAASSSVVAAVASGRSAENDVVQASV